MRRMQYDGDLQWSHCSIIGSVDGTLCSIYCGDHLTLVEETPWLLKAEKVTFTGKGVTPSYLAELFGRLLNTKVAAATDSDEPMDIDGFTGSVDELLQGASLRSESGPYDYGS